MDSVQKRELRTISIQVWSDSEASFYLYLSKIKQYGPLDPKDVKAFFDSIYWPETLPLENDQEMIVQMLNRAWQQMKKYLIKNKALQQVLTSKFETFLETEFCKLLIQHLDFCFDLKKKSIDNFDPIVNSKLAVTSYLFRILELLATSKSVTTTVKKSVSLDSSEFLNKTSFTDDGLLKLQHEDREILCNLYYKEPEGEIVPYSPENANDEITLGSTLFLEAGSDLLVFQLGEIVSLKVYANARLVDLKMVVDPNSKPQEFEFSMSEIKSILEGKPGNIEVKLIDEDTREPSAKPNELENPVVEVNINDDAPRFGFHPDVVHDYSLDVSLKHRIARVLFDCVHKNVGTLSGHSKHLIVGYLMVQLEFLDTEEQYLNSNRLDTYNSYVLNTIKYLLTKSKN
jgi:hypothetical protein